MSWMSDGLFEKPVESPYFRSLAKQVRLCPRCDSKTRLAGTLNPDAVYEVCDHCGLFATLVAPEWACEDDGSCGGRRRASGFTVIEGGLGKGAGGNA